MSHKCTKVTCAQLWKQGVRPSSGAGCQSCRRGKVWALRAIRGSLEGSASRTVIPESASLADVFAVGGSGDVAAPLEGLRDDVVGLTRAFFE